MLSVTSSNTFFRSSVFPTKYPVNGTAAYTLNKKLDLVGRDVLFLAEGNMTFAEAWIKNHVEDGETNVASRVICSELMTHNQMHRIPGVKRTIDWFEKSGGQFVYSLDCTSTDKTFKGHDFVRIQMNCPHDRSDYYAIPKTLPVLISGFFKASQQIQSKGATVHVTLLQPQADEDDNRWKLYQGHHFDIVSAAEGTGVQFETAILFDSTRFCYYQHRMKDSNKGAFNARFSREMAFLRGDNNTRTPSDRIDYDYIRLPAGPDEGEMYNCTYYTPYTNERRSYSQLPPMQGDNSTSGAEALMSIEEAAFAEAGTSMRATSG